MQMQQMAALQQQRDFEAQQRMQAEQQRMAQEQLLRDQYARQAQGRLAELEREILNMRGQYDKDQLLLEQYDRRVKALETEMQQMNDNFAQQSEAKDDMLKSLQGISDLNGVLIFRPGYYVEE
jgi:huntingtin-interacting protein 1-related protein